MICQQLVLPLNASQREEIKKFAAKQVNVIIQSCNNAECYAALEKIKAAIPIHYQCLINW